MDQQDLRARRSAENQVRFREVNERIAELSGALEPSMPTVGWTCECSRLDCAEHVEMAITQYEAVRAEPRLFLVAPGHDEPGVERVVSRAEGYWIVVKVGAGAEVAEQLDPRAV